MGSFSIALTGLRAQSEALDTIGNNLANLNTTAFKKQTTEFADLFYQQMGVNGSGDSLQRGLGVRVQTTDSSFAQGGLQTTSSATDMAIDGDGFFVVNNNGRQELTRAGNFQVANNGVLETADGQQVLGYQALAGNVTAASPLGSLTLPLGETQAAQPSTSFDITANLSSAASNNTQFNSGLTLYDSLGTAHVATVSFTKTGTNEWSYSMTLPTGEATGTPVNNTGTLEFDANGKLTSPSSAITGIDFPGLKDGAADLNLTWNLYDSSGNGMMSQTAAASSATASNQNGFASGGYEGFSVDNDGLVSAQFSNGQSTAIGQLALAVVQNEQGLTRTGGNDYTTTETSGEMTIGRAGTGGRGAIEDDTLEGSNVDIATEFSDLIVAQRGYEANSKTVTTFDTVTEETINMIR